MTAAVPCSTGPDAALDRLGDDVIQHVGHELQDDAAMLLISRRSVTGSYQIINGGGYTLW